MIAGPETRYQRGVFGSAAGTPYASIVLACFHLRQEYIGGIRNAGVCRVLFGIGES